MRKIKKPVDREKGKATGLIKDTRGNVSTPTNILQFPFEIINCTSCQIPFHCRRDQKLKTLCSQCWSWQKMILVRAILLYHTLEDFQ